MFDVNKFPCGAANGLNVFSHSPHMGTFLTPLHNGKKKVWINMNILFLVSVLAQHSHTCARQTAPALYSLLASWPSAFLWGLTLSLITLSRHCLHYKPVVLAYEIGAQYFFFFVCCASAGKPSEELKWQLKWNLMYSSVEIVTVEEQLWH